MQGLPRVLSGGQRINQLGMLASPEGRARLRLAGQGLHRWVVPGETGQGWAGRGMGPERAGQESTLDHAAPSAPLPLAGVASCAPAPCRASRCSTGTAAGTAEGKAVEATAGTESAPGVPANPRSPRGPTPPQPPARSPLSASLPFRALPSPHAAGGTPNPLPFPRPTLSQGTCERTPRRTVGSVTCRSTEWTKHPSGLPSQRLEHVTDEPSTTSIEQVLIDRLGFAFAAQLH